MLFKRTRALLNYAYKTRKFFFFLILFTVALIVAKLLDVAVLQKLIEIWSNHIDPLIGIATLIIAASVLRGEILQDWKTSLPKKLTVIFTYSGREVMRCERASLAGEGDIRGLGQQIGRQMVGGVNQESNVHLSFKAPLVQQTNGEVAFDDRIGFFLDYRADFILTTPPDGLNPNQCLLWTYPFEEIQKIPNSPRRTGIS